ncbi:hypothetical protein RHO15_09620 [Utexia brackfieldae]|uniref:DUF7370 family protein n=1 Tax=Utexia brackfieldae TaxID=3074108 RepID=UPI00370D8863
MTLDDVKKSLALMGYVAPDFILVSLIAIVSKIDDCMNAAGYDEATQNLIKLYAVMLMLSSSDIRKVSSESAPSGASRSYKYFDDCRDNLLSLINKLDTHECTSALPISSGALGQFKVFRG